MLSSAAAVGRTPLVTAEASFPSSFGKGLGQVTIFALDGTSRAVDLTSSSTPREMAARLRAPDSCSILALELGSSSFELLFQEDKLRDCFRRWGPERSRRTRLVLPLWSLPNGGANPTKLKITATTGIADDDAIDGGTNSTGSFGGTSRSSTSISAELAELRRETILLRESNRALASGAMLPSLAAVRVGVPLGGGRSAGSGRGASPVSPPLHPSEPEAPFKAQTSAAASEDSVESETPLFSDDSTLAGWLQKQGGRRAMSSLWQPRWCVLTACGARSFLEYYRQPGDPPSQARGRLLLSSVLRVVVDDRTLTVRLITHRKSYAFNAPLASEHRTWATAFQTAHALASSRAREPNASSSHKGSPHRRASAPASSLAASAVAAAQVSLRKTPTSGDDLDQRTAQHASSSPSPPLRADRDSNGSSHASLVEIRVETNLWLIEAVLKRGDVAFLAELHNSTIQTGTGVVAARVKFLEPLRALHGAIEGRCVYWRDVLRREAMAALFAALRDAVEGCCDSTDSHSPEERRGGGDGGELLSGVLEVAAAEGMEKELGRELDKGLRQILVDHLRDVGLVAVEGVDNEDLDSSEHMDGAEHGLQPPLDFAATMAACGGLVARLRGASAVVAPRFPPSLRFMERLAGATHAVVTEVVLQHVARMTSPDENGGHGSDGDGNGGGGDNSDREAAIRVEDALLLLAWAEDLEDALTEFAPELSLGPRLEQVFRGCFLRFLALLRAQVTRWAANALAVDLQAPVRRRQPVKLEAQAPQGSPLALASGSACSALAVTSAPEDLMASVGAALRLAASKLKDLKKRAPCVEAVADALMVYSDGQRRWMESQAKAITSPPASADDSAGSFDWERCCALANNNTRCVRMLEGIARDLGETATPRSSVDASSTPNAITGGADCLQYAMAGFAAVGSEACKLVAAAVVSELERGPLSRLFKPGWITTAASACIQRLPLPPSQDSGTGSKYQFTGMGLSRHNSEDEGVEEEEEASPSECVLVVMATLEDYFSDLSAALQPEHFTCVVAEAISLVAREYMKALVSAGAAVGGGGGVGTASSAETDGSRASPTALGRQLVRDMDELLDFALKYNSTNLGGDGGPQSHASGDSNSDESEEYSGSESEDHSTSATSSTEDDEEGRVEGVGVAYRDSISGGSEGLSSGRGSGGLGEVAGDSRADTTKRLPGSRHLRAVADVGWLLIDAAEDAAHAEATYMAQQPAATSSTGSLLAIGVSSGGSSSGSGAVKGGGGMLRTSAPEECARLAVSRLAKPLGGQAAAVLAACLNLCNVTAVSAGGGGGMTAVAGGPAVSASRLRAILRQAKKMLPPSDSPSRFPPLRGHHSQSHERHMPPRSSTLEVGGDSGANSGTKTRSRFSILANAMRATRRGSAPPSLQTLAPYDKE